jgi:hypothetical protein
VMGKCKVESEGSLRNKMKNYRKILSTLVT